MLCCLQSTGLIRMLRRDAVPRPCWVVQRTSGVVRSRDWLRTLLFVRCRTDEELSRNHPPIPIQREIVVLVPPMVYAALLGGIVLYRCRFCGRLPLDTVLSLTKRRLASKV